MIKSSLMHAFVISRSKLINDTITHCMHTICMNLAILTYFYQCSSLHLDPHWKEVSATLPGTYTIIMWKINICKNGTHMVRTWYDLHTNHKMQSAIVTLLCTLCLLVPHLLYTLSTRCVSFTICIHHWALNLLNNMNLAKREGLNIYRQWHFSLLPIRLWTMKSFECVIPFAVNIFYLFSVTQIYLMNSISFLPPQINTKCYVLRFI